MKVYLMRHGDYTLDVTQQKDVLTEKGKSDIEQLTHALARANVRVSQILHSGKFRAQQTAEILAQGQLSAQPPQPYPGLQPNDDVDAFAEQLQYWNDDCLIVGHLPFMGLLVSQLLTGNTNRDLVEFDVGTIVCLNKIEERRWIIQWVLKPSNH